MALTISNRFINGTAADAAKMNANFDAVSLWAADMDSSITTLTAADATLTTNLGNIGNGSFFAYATANQGPLTASAWATVTLSDTGTDAFNPQAWFVSNVYTPHVAGAYLLNISLQLTSGSTAGRTIKVSISKNTTQYEVALITAGTNDNASATILLKANGTTDAFKFEVYPSGSGVTIDYATMSGYCVKPD